MIEVNLKEKLKQEKQKKIIERKDLDLALYLDFQRELLEYRVACISIYPIIEINKMRRKHNVILERLSKRLSIPTIMSNLEKMKKYIKK